MRKIIIVVLAIVCLTMQTAASDVIYSWHGNEKKIALTFDDGPHPYRTEEILDLLDEYGIKATFFVVGQNVELYPEILQAEYDAGHEIGNHSYYHTDMKKLSYSDICREIESTEKKIFETIEYKTHLLRPPGGQIGNELLKAAREEDYSLICWSVDTRDWAHTPVNDIVKNVLSSVEAGDIILFHDYVSGDSPTVPALRAIIPKLIEEGYVFVTLSELMNSGEN